MNNSCGQPNISGSRLSTGLLWIEPLLLPSHRHALLWKGRVSWDQNLSNTSEAHLINIYFNCWLWPELLSGVWNRSCVASIGICFSCFSWNFWSGRAKSFSGLKAVAISSCLLNLLGANKRAKCSILQYLVSIKPKKTKKQRPVLQKNKWQKRSAFLAMAG